MYRPGYGVVTSVLAVLCLVGFVATLLRPGIPPNPENPMSLAQEEFLRQAGNQSIDWKPLNAESLAEARRAGRPILLLVGTPTSVLGKELDRNTFPSTEIAIYLSRNFTCLRADGASHPRWMNAFLPFSRLRADFESDIQIWALDPGGRAFAFIARSEAKDEFDPDTVLPQLIDLRRRYDNLSQGGGSAVGEVQHRENLLLSGLSGNGLVPFQPYGQKLATGAATGWAHRGLTHPQPWALRYLLMTGQIDALRAAQQSLLRSPMADLLDGGFFHTRVEVPGSRWIELEKLSTENANLMSVLAQVAGVTGDPEVRRFVEETWRYLAETATADRGFYFGQTEPSGGGLRSPHYSVSARRARESLPSDLREWALQHLGIDVARQPQGLPYLERANRQDPKTDEVLRRLRASAGPSAKGVDPGLSHVSFTVTARAIETARLLNDPKRLQQAVDWLEELEELREGDDIRRRLVGGNPRLGSLLDYLSYADARLQDYLATGRVRSFDLGFGVLQKARKLFRGTRRGVFMLSRPEIPSPLPDTVFPEIADNLRESGTARAIRLMLAYGRLLGASPNGIDLQREAHEAVSLFAPLAAEGGPVTAAFFCSAAEAEDDLAAFAVGPDATELANALAASTPTRLCAPAYGPVRPDLQRLSPGIYLVDGKIEGPLTLEEARKRLPRVLDLGPTS